MSLAFLTCSVGLAASRKNVLFFASDDMRVQLGAERVPGTHAMHTPRMDELVGKSLFLRKAQVQQAVCSPTRTSVLTSRYPDTTRVWDLYSYFREPRRSTKRAARVTPSPRQSPQQPPPLARATQETSEGTTPPSRSSSAKTAT